MAVDIATWVLTGVGIYAALGFVFALVFVTRGVQRIDPAASDGTRGFRALIFPGVVALWPLLASRWRRGAGELPEESGAHRLAARTREATR